ncbi:MAG: hypothetical protein LUG26_04790 [Ruminococcus sp.]|nr:hypothetical protein [Ruminococcus sp.]
MPRNQFQRCIFALLTVIITVHGYVFYSLYVISGSTLMEPTGESGVIAAINAQGGVLLLNHMVSIWAIVLVEFCFAYCLEVFLGSPASFRLASKVFNVRTTHPVIFETDIICATVGIMCPVMSFIAAWLYYPYYEGFSIFTLLANWLKLVCYNFPFAFFSQLFFIQPFVHKVFGILFRKQIKAAESEGEHAQAHPAAM